MNDVFLGQAYRLAIMAYRKDEVPVGCVIVKENKIIGSAYNQTKFRNSPQAHAELLAIKQASLALNDERLIDCDLYTSLEPCVMCSGAIFHARIRRVYYIAPELRLPSLSDVALLEGHNHRLEYYQLGLAKYPSDRLLKRYFQKKRKK